MTTIYLGKGNLSVDLDLTSYPTLELLNKNIADFLSSDETDSKAPKFLYYHVGEQKYVI